MTAARERLLSEREPEEEPRSKSAATDSLRNVFPHVSTLASNVFLDVSTLSWIENYCSDLHLFQSHSMWCEKTVREMKTLSGDRGKGKHPTKVLASLLGQLLTECEHLGPELEKSAVDNLLKAVFVLGEGALATNDSALLVASRGDPTSDPFLIPSSKSGFKARFETFLKVPTWLDALSFWQMRFEKEMNVQEDLDKLREKMKREKKIENGVLNRTCTAWTKPMMVLMMHTWQVNTAMDKNREVLGKYVMKFTQLKPSHVFGAWKKWAFWQKKSRAADDLEDLIRKVEARKKDLEETKVRVQKAKVLVSKASAVNSKIKRKLDEALNILHMPARQPLTLAKIVKGFSKTLGKLKKFLDPFVKECVDDVLLVAPHTIRLAPAFKYTNDFDKMVFLGHPDFLDMDKGAGEDIEGAIRLWLPGQLKGAEEFTYASQPAKTKAGKVVIRWLHNMLKSRWSRQGKSIDKDLLVRTWNKAGIDLEGKDAVDFLCEVVQEVAKSHPMMSEKDLLSRVDDYGDFDDNSSVESLEDEKYLKFHERNPHVNECNALLTTICDMTEEKAGFLSRFRYLSQQDVTVAKEPESKKLRKIREAHLRQAQKRSADSGIVVNVFSQYMGRRVPVIDANVQKVRV